MNWSGVKASTIPSVKTLASFGVGNLKKISNLIKIEILRDFWQIISLFFEGLGDSLPSSYKDFFGNFSVTFSFCFSCWWQNDDTQAMLSIIIFCVESIVALICMALFICFRKEPDAINQGLETTVFASVSKKYKKYFKLLILALTTLYLPIFRDVVMIFSCDTKYFPDSGDCSSGKHTGLCILAFFSMILYVIPLPIILWIVIKKYKPIPSMFDAEGNQRVGGYTDNDYKEDLEKDECPYKTIYNGYERKWSHYKVISLLIKILLILPVALIVNTNEVGDRASDSDKDSDKTLLAIQSSCTVVILTIYCILTSYSQPFIENSDDQVDMAARYTALVVAILAFMASQIDGAEMAFGILLNIVTVVGGFIILLYVLTGFKKVKLFLQKFGQRIKFTNTRDTFKPLIFSDQLDIDKERKFRVWHEFWDTVMRQDKDFRIPNLNANNDSDNDDEDAEKYEPKALGYQYGNSPPYLMDFKGTIGERHEEMKEIIEFESFPSYLKNLQVMVNDNEPFNLQIINAMKYVMTHLNGIDVFWNGECISFEEESPSDTEILNRVNTAIILPNKSVTKFGKLYIIPFPFCAVFVSDDDESTKTVFSISPVIAGKKFDSAKGIQNLLELVEQNANGEVQRRKEVRLKLRAMEGSMCHWPLQKWISKAISRSTGSGDNRRTETKHVQVLFSFNDGQFCISRHGSKAIWKSQNGKKVDVTRGFVSHLKYRDGTGRHNYGGWSPHSWSHEPLTVYGVDFGLNHQFQETPQFQQFMRQNYRMDFHEQGKFQVIRDFKMYSDHYKNEFIAKEKTLSYGFWYYVYNNDAIRKSVLQRALQYESNEKLQKLITDPEYIESVNMVFEKLNFFNKDKKHSFWFIFFHDVWINNLQMPIFAKNEELLSPFSADSLCYKYIEEKSELVEILSENGLCRRSGGCRKGWINKGMIDELYAKLDMLGIKMEMDGKAERIVHLEMGPVPQDENVFLEQYEKASRMIRTICNEGNENAAVAEEEKGPG